MSEKLYLYPIWLRLWHALNALFFLILLVTGLSMQYSDVSFPLIRFDWAVTAHNLAGIGITLSYLFFLAGNLFTTNGKHYSIRVQGLFSDLLAQGRYYMFGIFSKQIPPFPVTARSKFNPLQRVSYIGAMYVMFPVVAITGWALLFPETIVRQVFGMSGTLLTALFHIVMGFAMSVFMIVHIYMCTVGKTPLSNFRSMVNGYHESH